MPESKSGALPLGYRAIFKHCIRTPDSPSGTTSHLNHYIQVFLVQQKAMAILIDRTFTTIQCLSFQQPPLISGDADLSLSAKQSPLKLCWQAALSMSQWELIFELLSLAS